MGDELKSTFIQARDAFDELVEQLDVLKRIFHDNENGHDMATIEDIESDLQELRQRLGDPGNYVSVYAQGVLSQDVD